MRFADLRGAARVDVTESALTAAQRVIAECTDIETGGVLIGRYSDTAEVAIVESVSPPPADSRRARTTFMRGSAGLRTLLDREWAAGRHYLGEWHYHPGCVRPEASITDTKSLLRIARDVEMRCVNPIMLIFGDGDVPSAYYVSEDMIEMLALMGAEDETVELARREDGRDRWPISRGRRRLR